jgi:acetolactate synthase-1/2/3 large subunit
VGNALNPMKVSDYIANFLAVQGVTHVFELSGGMITHILDSVYLLGKTQIISMHHEQAAAFAADALGRITGIPGIALTTSGPGASNLLTGIASCYFDSSPAVFITGQVNTNETKGNRKIRQLGFQETDIISMAHPITKACFSVSTPDSIVNILYQSFQIATSGRPGPVLIDIPMNIQRMEINVEDTESVGINPETTIQMEESVLQSLEQDIIASKSPLILAGRGICASFTRKELNTFSLLTNIPVVTSLLGMDCIEYNNPLRVGFIGSYGNRWANLSLGECDLLIVLGSRLDIRQTGADTVGFKGDKKIYHIDCELTEINNRIKDCTPIHTDVKTFLSQANKYFKIKKLDSKKNWIHKIEMLKRKWKDTDEIKDCKGINPNLFIHALSKKSQHAQGFIADVGNHQMWTAQSLELQKNQFFITSGGMGAMGFALPASIGASLAFNKLPVVAIIGDGSFQLNIQELQTIVRNKLPVKIVILNNSSLGMIRQFQDSYFNGRHQSTVWGYSAPNFEAISLAYGIDALTISTKEEIELGLAKLWENPSAPFLLQVMIDQTTNAYPKIAFGKPITEMEPYFIPTEIEGT